MKFYVFFVNVRTKLNDIRERTGEFCFFFEYFPFEILIFFSRKFEAKSRFKLKKERRKNILWSNDVDELKAHWVSNAVVDQEPMFLPS